MKITYISSSTIPSRTANSIHVMKMCQAFARNGHEVVLIVPDTKHGTQSGVEDVFSFYGVNRCFEIVQLPWLKFKGRGYCYGYFAAKKAKSLKPDIVYCRNTVGCFLSARFGLPVVFESHAPLADNGRISEWMFRRLITHTKFRKLVVITSALKEYFEIKYPQIGEKIQIAPDGADPVPESTKPVILPNKNKRFQVGYLGQLYQGKGMEIVAKLAKNCPWADFHIVGGVANDILYWQGVTAGLKNITYHGYVPHAVSYSYIIAFDVLLLPNQRNIRGHSGSGDIAKWTSPLKMFEYMAAGKSILASDLSVLKEVLVHEHNALLCPPDDASAWEKSLERLCDDNNLQKRLGREALRDFKENYTWQTRAKNVIIVR
ncbi:MAG: glycosyltransferase family 4 protein [Caldisericaceae bacterium]|nr:glycosyltransferase family 4 protein [Caldisericaceae bacterium]